MPVNRAGIVVGIEGIDAIVLCSDDEHIVTATRDAHSGHPEWLRVYRTIDRA